MATILFSAVGTLIGGPIGGAIGALIGRQVDSAIIGGGRAEGPRLKELTATTSSYGAPIARHFGKMRVPGSVIWATDLVEHRDTQGGGKARPKVTTYSYTASFAVALASRPILDIGRIWADGNLLRGEAGDLKAGGQMRIYLGTHDQPADPLLSQAEGANRCPAYRGLAYVVFEDLELGDFFNRIPALTFEVIADDGEITLQDMLGDVIEDLDANLPLTGVKGFSCEGTIGDMLQSLDQAIPMDCDAGAETLIIARERLQSAAIALPEPAASTDDGDFGRAAGYARRRAPQATSPLEVLRYYDIDRDYQPGVQRAGMRPAPGQPRTIDLPAAMTALDARTLVTDVARRVDWSRDQMAWRSTELDLAVSPGAIVSLPQVSGRWKVIEWEWRERGVELSLARIVPTGQSAVTLQPTDSGRATAPVDVPAPASKLFAYELPWDGAGSGDTPYLFAAVSSPGATWAGASLFADTGDGELHPLGTSGRSRATIGTADGVLPPGNPLLLDRQASVVVNLLDSAGMALSDATLKQLLQGANKALLGSELVQFGRAQPLGSGRWRISQFLRGRAGTEWAVSTHLSGEPFVLLDAAPVALDPVAVGSQPGTEVVALGRGDAEPVSSAIMLRGITVKPLSPVRARHVWRSDGSLELGWTRRARGAWYWLDGVGTPLHEQAEVYIVGFGPQSAPVASWTTAMPELVLPPATLATLAAASPDGEFWVRQQGSYAVSDALPLGSIS